MIGRAAPWAPRAGAAVVVRDDELFLLGGEDEFACRVDNDVWAFGPPTS